MRGDVLTHAVTLIWLLCYPTRPLKRMAARLSEHGLIPIDVIAVRESNFRNAMCGSLSYEIRTKGIEL